MTNASQRRKGGLTQKVINYTTSMRNILDNCYNVERLSSVHFLIKKILHVLTFYFGQTKCVTVRSFDLPFQK